MRARGVALVIVALPQPPLFLTPVAPDYYGRSRHALSHPGGQEGFAMRDVRKIGRRTWLTRVTGGAIAVWTSLSLSGCSGWAVSIGSTGRQASDPGGDGIRRVPLGQNGFTPSYIVIRGKEVAIVDTGV